MVHESYSLSVYLQNGIVKKVGFGHWIQKDLGWYLLESVVFAKLEHLMSLGFHFH